MSVFYLFFEEEKSDYCDTLGVVVVTKLQPHLITLKSVQHFQMKLGTHVSMNNMHVYSKSHNSGFNIYSVITTFFDLEKADERWQYLCGTLVYQTMILLSTDKIGLEGQPMILEHAKRHLVRAVM